MPEALPTAAVAALACPVCRSVLTAVDSGLRCDRGHLFDRARQGYVHLAATAIRHPGDTAVMVQARQRVQEGGLFAAVTAALVAAVPTSAGVVLDLGAGTGHHLAAVLRAADQPAAVAGGVGHRPGRVGIAVDTSKPALRQAARAHARLLAVAADATGTLPLRDASVDAALIAFAPRAADELARLLPPGGVVVVATPMPAHLSEIVVPLGMLAVPADKERAVAGALAPAFAEVGQHVVHHTAAIDRATAVDLALMGPTGFHADEAALRLRAGALPEQLDVTIAVTVQRFTRR